MTESRRVGVTGAAGYIGSRVVADLLNAGHDVVPVDDGHAAKVESIDGLEMLDVDVRNRGALREAFDGTDAVFHLAALTGVSECEENPETAFDVNVQGTENVAWCCRESGTPLVFPCSMAVVGEPESFPISADSVRDPVNQYGLTKAMSEDDVHRLADGSFPAHVYVKSNLYGHHTIGQENVGKGTVINVFVGKALAGEPLTVHEPGTQARDFLHVKDVARAYLLSLDELLDADDGAVSFPLASGDCRSILEIAETVQRIVEEERGERPEITMVENPRGEEAAGDDFTVDTTAAREAIGFEPEHSVEETIRAMVRADGGDGG